MKNGNEPFVLTDKQRRVLWIVLAAAAALAAFGVWLIVPCLGYTYMPRELEGRFFGGLAAAAAGVLVAVFPVLIMYMGRSRTVLTEYETAKRERRTETSAKVLTVLAPASAAGLFVLLQFDKWTTGTYWFLILAAAAAIFGFAARENHPKMTVIVLTLFTLAFLIPFTVKAGSLLHYRTFRPIDLNAANPAAGSGVVCYDLDGKKYCGRFTPDKRGAKNAADTGYVVLFRAGTKTEYLNYRSEKDRRTTNRVAATLGTVDVSVFDVKAGKIIAEETFSANPPSSVGSSTRSVRENIDPRRVKQWVSGVLRDRNN